MKREWKRFGLALGVIAVLGTGTISMPLYAAEAETPKVNALVKKDAIQLINVAGKQRMLSQRIAKDYLYIGQKVATDKATRQLKRSLKEFRENQAKLSEMINDPEIKNLLEFVNMSLQEL
jgi:hypothetical protein